MDDAVTDNTETQTRQAATEPQDRVPTTPVIDAEAIAARARDTERERVGTIYDLAGRLHLERSFADDLVKRGVTLDAARSEILDKVATDAEDAGFASRSASRSVGAMGASPVVTPCRTLFCTARRRSSP